MDRVRSVWALRHHPRALAAVSQSRDAVGAASTGFGGWVLRLAQALARMWGTLALLVSALKRRLARRYVLTKRAGQMWLAERPRLRRVLHWLTPGRRFGYYFGLVVVLLSLASGFATYLILTGLTPIIPTHEVVVTVLLINLALILIMAVVIVRQVVTLWLARRRQAAGARLHVRILSLFCVVAVLPAILLAIFASVSLDRGLDAWFSSRTKSIIQNSINVAMAYLQEHGQVIRTDIVAMAQDVDANAQLIKDNPQEFAKLLNSQAAMRALPLAYIIGQDGKVLASAANRINTAYVPPPADVMNLARDGTVIVIAPSRSDRVGAVKRLDNLRDSYLYVARSVNPVVIDHLRDTRASVAEYRRLEQRRTGVQVAFGLMYVAIAMTLLLAAMWLGLWFANRLVSPIRRLIGAAQEVSQGNLDVSVAISPREGDIGQLGATFNTMTSELRRQRNELISTNDELDERMRFIEAVLSGVSAGVIGLDEKGRITLVNRSAAKLLGREEDALIGEDLVQAVPEFAAIMRKASRKGAKPAQHQVTIHVEGRERNFAVRLTREQSEERDFGLVLTFDDITELVLAQRTSAWADVARRIAHEIKNPLTPIQLSAERIRRKYGNAITHDREVFEQCTNTIIRQVEDIGRMVDEFSSFARMPKPQMEPQDIRDVVREAVFLFKMSHPEIRFSVHAPETVITVKCDRRLMSQAVTNLVKNAREAIETFVSGGSAPEGYQGHITVTITASDSRFAIAVADNGCGLPDKDRHRLIEPYVTRREKGTGLGLAIVQKIVEQHNGTLILDDAAPIEGESHRGAIVTMLFPRSTAKAPAEPAKARPADTTPTESQTDTRDPDPNKAAAE